MKEEINLRKGKNQLKQIVDERLKGMVANTSVSVQY